MRILALDVGDKTIGIAVSDELNLTAQGVETIRRTTKLKDFIRLKELIDTYNIDTILIGLPKNMNGTIGERGIIVQEFAKELDLLLLGKQKIKLWDERLSTAAAEKSLISFEVRRAKRKMVIDKMAAVFILQGYLDSLN